jgi:outer membrane biosynthesis protein TonB
MMGSVALHGTVLALLLISWRFSHELKVGAVVPVTIVANAPETNLKAAEQAPIEQTAQTETPVAEAPPEVAPPPAQPTPAPPTPKPAPPKPAPEPAPAPKAAQKPAKPEKTLDLDALASSLAKSAPKTQPPKPSSAVKGPARPETALRARPALGTGNSAAAAVSGLADELQRRWNPNCEVQGGRDVIIKATFELGAGGNVVGDVQTQIVRGQGGVASAAAVRARSAVFAAAPFRNLPREFYGERISVNFNAREACS